MKQYNEFLRLFLDYLKRKRVICFGTGSYFSRSILKDTDCIEISYFVDNDLRKEGGTFLNKAIYNPSKLLKENKNNIVVLITSSFNREITEQLEAMGFQKNYNFFDINDISFYSTQTISTESEIKKYLKVNSGLKSFNVNDLFLNKRSNTLFVLGSGSSINRFNDSIWKEINNYDSYGFNFWIMHDFIPTYYMFETSPTYQRNKDLFNILNKRREEFKGVPIIKKDVVHSIHRYKGWEKEVKTNIILSKDIELLSNNKKEFIDDVNLIKNLNILDTMSNIIPRRKASLSYILFLAIKMGYEKIILCGVDLNNTKYFYEDNTKYFSDKGYPITQNIQTNKIHSTNDGEYGLTIAEIIDVINKELLKPRGIEIFVAFKSSALYPNIQSYFD